MSSGGSSRFWDSYGSARSDPRTIITPDAFSVHPELLGLPLAQHPRRLAAIFIDLVLVAVLAQAGGLVLGVLAVGFLLRVTFRKRDAARPSSAAGAAFRAAVGCFGAGVLLVTALVMWAVISNGERVRVDADRTRAEVLERLGELEDQGVLGPGVSAALEGLGTEGPGEPHPGADDAAAAGAEPPAAEPSGDAAGSPPAPALPPEALDTIRALEERLAGEIERRSRAEAAAADLGSELVAVQEELAEAEARGSRFPGIRAVLARIADDLDVGFGWGALYFTVFTTWWKGRTPGKRLMRLRVLRLSGEPMTWWESFERYGGYAAGFATGLLGFAQVYWDPNRQAIHDRIGRTVVVQDGKPPVPGKWSAQGAAPPGAPASARSARRPESNS